MNGNGKIDEFLEIQNKKNRVALSIFRRLCNLGYDDNFWKHTKIV